KGKTGNSLAQAAQRGTDWLTRLAARQVAAYSRQDEFLADLGAAELCGSGPIRSALSKLEELSRISARLPWNERISQLQSDAGFSRWLVSEFSSAKAAPSLEASEHVFDRYATHPSLCDRLNALPPPGLPSLVSSAPAIGLLA